MSAPALRGRPPRPGSGVAGPGQMAFRAFQFWLVNYRRTWRGSIYSSLLTPVLYMGAMGLGLGTLVDQHHGTASLGNVSYLVFLAPGLMAATAMQTAVSESLYPVYSAVKWQQTYQAAAATPLKPGDIFRGHLLFTTMRLTMNMTVFLGVMSAFGAVRSVWVVAALPAAVLTGLAFATLLDAFAVIQKNDQPFNMIFRFGMIPLFLFSGTFFPVTQLPGWIRPLAYATPLWHGVALCRALSLGRADLAGAAGHIAYLVIIAVLGLLAGELTYRRRLHV